MISPKHWLARLWFRDPRKSKRRHPALVAHYWTGTLPQGQKVRDISAAGVYLLTQHRWYLGTEVTITLQAAGRSGTSRADVIVVRAKVVRVDAEGVGFAFVFAHAGAASPAQNNMEAVTDRKSLNRFLEQFGEGAGVSDAA